MLESDDEKDENMGASSNGDDGDDDDDDDRIPLSIQLAALQAWSSIPAEERREAEVIRPWTGPVPFPHPDPESFAVLRGTLPDEPSIIDLGGDPNTVSSDSSPSSESSENVIVYSTDRDPSPSNAAPSEIREPPPSTDTRESIGQADIAAELIGAVTARLLREEE
ncbi:hypothetical protein RHMOL_Rhmol13G0187400 [Rhododendron molle]|uniref:Uncharacterized protein n=1 Tax=Rhododendron molle TaxID=49168 RepID=A0ACC0L892_RHOML|nr:hypothetical protein RHMOL_Rhmol13G0187400 [Rhododendron molle]